MFYYEVISFFSRKKHITITDSSIRPRYLQHTHHKSIFNVYALRSSFPFFISGHQRAATHRLYNINTSFCACTYPIKLQAFSFFFSRRGGLFLGVWEWVEIFIIRFEGEEEKGFELGLRNDIQWIFRNGYHIHSF